MKKAAGLAFHSVHSCAPSRSAPCHPAVPLLALTSAPVCVCLAGAQAALFVKTHSSVARFCFIPVCPEARATLPSTSPIFTASYVTSSRRPTPAAHGALLPVSPPGGPSSRLQDADVTLPFPACFLSCFLCCTVPYLFPVCFLSLVSLLALNLARRCGRAWPGYGGRPAGQRQASSQRGPLSSVL